MKRFFTLILMLVTMFTFTQKAAAFVHLFESKTDSMVDCNMSMDLSESSMEMSKIDCGANERSHTMKCQSDCDFMTMVTVLYFILHENTVSQPQPLSQLSYKTGITGSPYYFPETLYRPPLLN